MLAQRVLTRPATFSRRGFQLQRRFIHPSKPELPSLPRPNTWLAKLRFRADGESRSILRGAFTLYLCFVVPPIYKEFTSTRTRFEFVGKFADSSLPEAIDYFLQTDLTYDSVDFDDPISTISYFTKLCLWFPAQNQEASIQVREEEVNKSFRYVMTRIIKTKDGSIQTTEAQVHHILRSAAEKIHFILREFNQSLIAAELCERELSDTVLEALKSISDVLDNSSDLEIQTYDRPSIS